jgi:hypothetical protein
MPAGGLRCQEGCRQPVRAGRCAWRSATSNSGATWIISLSPMHCAALPLKPMKIELVEAGTPSLCGSSSAAHGSPRAELAEWAHHDGTRRCRLLAPRCRAAVRLQRACRHALERLALAALTTTGRTAKTGDGSSCPHGQSRDRDRRISKAGRDSRDWQPQSDGLGHSIFMTNVNDPCRGYGQAQQSN